MELSPGSRVVFLIIYRPSSSPRMVPYRLAPLSALTSPGTQLLTFCYDLGGLFASDPLIPHQRIAFPPDNSIAPFYAPSWLFGPQISPSSPPMLLRRYSFPLLMVAPAPDDTCQFRRSPMVSISEVSSVIPSPCAFSVVFFSSIFYRGHGQRFFIGWVSICISLPPAK